MNPVISFVAIVSLLLALSARNTPNVNPSAARQSTASKIALNHNETMVNDAALVQPADGWSQWLMSVQAFFVTSFSTDLPGRKGGCDEFGCGGNHNETMVRESSW